jgi:hypothetical protein
MRADLVCQGSRREMSDAHARDGQLTGLERRCLHKHICECHEIVMLTMRGVLSVQDEPACAQLARVRALLSCARRLIEAAERAAVEQME